MELAGWITLIVLAVDLLIRAGLSVRVIMRRLPVGVSLAWLFIVLMVPLLGAVFYLLLGELRLGHTRAARAEAIHGPYQLWLEELRQRMHVDWDDGSEAARPLSHLVERAVGIPALPGNQLQLIGDWQLALTQLIQDIDEAKRTCHLEFYIWNEGGMADQVMEALCRAAQRGVVCRVLLDDVGSRGFLRGSQARRLRQAGVQLKAALPASLLRMAFVRFDLRMHRKIAVVDGRLAYTGSLNLIDPRFFKQESGVGQWVDAMVRIEGPVVEALAITFLEDWTLETGTSLEELHETGDVHPMRPRGNAAVQLIPSGPVQRESAMERVLISTLYQARRDVCLTTPYFVPDEPLLAALISAVQRGVNVTLILPAKVDSKFVRWASLAFLDDLVRAGVRVLMFHGGLLHTKSVTVDGEISLFGSLNLDPRSLHLNFEITLAIYDKDFTGELLRLQSAYARESKQVTAADGLQRSRPERLLQNAARLLGPLL
jgi:cardiolipin synthase